MSNPVPAREITSSALEKIALDRYRQLVPMLPLHCRVFRESWGNSTVLCFDLQDSFAGLPFLPETIEVLLETADQLGLAQALLFRRGQKFLGLKTRSPMH